MFFCSLVGLLLLDAQTVIAQEYMPLVMGIVAQRSQAMTKEMMKEMAEVVPAAKPANSGATRPAVKAGSKPPAK